MVSAGPCLASLSFDADEWKRNSTSVLQLCNDAKSRSGTHRFLNETPRSLMELTSSSIYYDLQKQVQKCLPNNGKSFDMCGCWPNLQSLQYIHILGAKQQLLLTQCQLWRDVDKNCNAWMVHRGRPKQSHGWTWQVPTNLQLSRVKIRLAGFSFGSLETVFMMSTHLHDKCCFNSNHISRHLLRYCQKSLWKIWLKHLIFRPPSEQKPSQDRFLQPWWKYMTATCLRLYTMQIAVWRSW